MSLDLSTGEIYTERQVAQELPLFITLNHSRRLVRLFVASSILIFLLTLSLIILR